MNTQIQVSVRQVYGRTLIYPVCDKAKLFAELARKETLNLDDVGIIRALGVDVEEVYKPGLPK